MNCPKCNAPNPEGSKFCASCGAPMGVEPQPEQQANNQSYSQAGQQFNTQTATDKINQGIANVKKDPKKFFLIIGIVAFVLIAALVTLFFIVTHKKKIDLSEYTTVTFEGYNGYGTADVDLDEDAIATILLDEKGIKIEDYKNVFSALSDTEDLLPIYSAMEALDCSIDKTENLKNGDTVTVTYTFNNDLAKKCGVKFTPETYTQTVSGLEEVKTVDPFEGVTLEYSGTSPDVSASVKTDSNPYDLYYQVEPSYGIKKGDKVTVSISYDEDNKKSLMENHGIILSSNTKEFTVDEVDSYVTTKADITDDLLDKMKKQTQDVITAYKAKYKSNFSISDVKYAGYYLLTSKADSWPHNKIYVVYSAKASGKDKGSFKNKTIYFPLKFSDAILYADGTGYVDTNSNYLEGYNSGYTSGWYTLQGYKSVADMKNALVDSEKSNYSVETEGDIN
ncbi:MAG: zinc ribbon domain-containing protein [Eubacterium sp.]|nr:zinc ribbon domain-containing protein [Eubacterium sp.]